MSAPYGLAGTRALVTGGAGTIGSTIVDQLLAAGAAEVVVLDDLSRGRRANLADAAAPGPLTLVEKGCAGPERVVPAHVHRERPRPQWGPPSPSRRHGGSR